MQMPANFDQPSHRLMAGLATSERWKGRLGSVDRARPVAAPAEYRRMLQGSCDQIDIWATEYLQVLEGDDPVVSWVRGTGLRPYLDLLDGQERESFIADYSKLVGKAYPRQPDGRTEFPFRRVFFVARKSA